MKKRIVSLLLASVMVFCAIPMVSFVTFAQDGEEQPSDLFGRSTRPLPSFGDALTDYNTNVVDSELEKYIDLYYDDGHLMSMMNLHSIKADEVVNNGENVDINGARVVLGNLHDGGEYDSYVKILAGKYAGEYYRLGNENLDNQYTNKIEIDDEGSIKYNEHFAELEFRNVGIMYSYTYAESEINTVKPEPSRRSEFLYNTDYMQYDGTYGNFTQEGSYRMLCDYYFPTELEKAKTSYCAFMSFGYQKGSFMVRNYAGTDLLQYFYAGNAHSEGTAFETGGGVYVMNRTYHYMARVAFKNPTTIFRTMYIFGPKGMITPSSGTEWGYDLNKFGNDRSLFTAQNRGVKMYTLRLYDVSLTPDQMRQNHFADLCYYYKLENTDKLLALGPTVLTSDFYDIFYIYNLGMSDEKVEEMQRIIDNTILTATGKTAVLKHISDSYNSALENATASNSAVEAVLSVLNGVDAYITEIGKISAVNAESEALLLDYLAGMNSLKSDIEYYYQAAVGYDANVQAVKELVTEKFNSSNEDEEITTLFENSAFVSEKMHYSNEGALHNTQFALLANECNSKIAQILIDAKNANAQASFDMSQYIQFVGYQIHINDFAAMRALFAVNADKLASGYTYDGSNYEIAAAGFVFVDKNSFDKNIVYDGRYVSAVSEEAIVKDIDAWSREQSMDETASNTSSIIGAQAHAIVCSYDGVAAPDAPNAYQKEYCLRTFAVVVGGGTTFVRYTDVVSENLGSSVSLYELAKYVQSIERPENLTPTSYITRVVLAVDGDND